MDSYKNCIKGSCHCSNITLSLYTDKSDSDFVPRTCQCDLCKKHGASWISDPLGEVHVAFLDRGDVSFYRFDHGIAKAIYFDHRNEERRRRIPAVETNDG